MNQLRIIFLLFIILPIINGCSVQKKNAAIKPSDTERAQIRLEKSNYDLWAEQCLRDFESIKPGMSRQEVEQKFSMDGGLQMVSPVRFTHPQCKYFKVDVSFEFKRNINDQNRAILSDTDKVINVSKPYMERPYYD